jgi:plastocyanin
MNFAYGVIAVVGVLVAISIALIAADPDEIPEPRAMVIPENKIAQIEDDLNQLSVNPAQTEIVIKTADNSGTSMDCQTSLDCYTPSIVTVSVGDVVTMTNSDSTAAMHSFTAGTVDGFTPSPSGTFDTGIMSADDSFEWIPENAGDTPYYCMLHTWMQGTIIVE